MIADAYWDTVAVDVQIAALSQLWQDVSKHQAYQDLRGCYRVRWTAGVGLDANVHSGSAILRVDVHWDRHYAFQSRAQCWWWKDGQWVDVSALSNHAVGEVETAKELLIERACRVFGWAAAIV